MRQFLSLLVAIFGGSCMAGAPQSKKIHDTLHGVDFIIEHLSGPALSQSQDRIYIQVGGGKKLVFRGRGGVDVTLLPMRRDFIIIQYCGGVVEMTDSFLSPTNDQDEAVAVRLQPIVISNVKIGGSAFCRKEGA